MLQRSHPFVTKSEVFANEKTDEDVRLQSKMLRGKDMKVNLFLCLFPQRKKPIFQLELKEKKANNVIVLSSLVKKKKQTM